MYAGRQLNLAFSLHLNCFPLHFVFKMQGSPILRNKAWGCSGSAFNAVNWGSSKRSASWEPLAVEYV